MYFQTYSLIFTSPSSAKGIANDDDENIPPFGSKSKSPKATRNSVAQKLKLETVSPRSIAYAAVMVCDKADIN